MKKVYVTIGYNDAIEFKEARDAWEFANDVFKALCKAENPEIASIDICFKEEGSEDKNELPAI